MTMATPPTTTGSLSHQVPQNTHASSQTKPKTHTHTQGCRRWTGGVRALTRCWCWQPCRMGRRLALPDGTQPTGCATGASSRLGANHVVMLVPHSFDVECGWDYLHVYDGPTTQWTRVAAYCGNHNAYKPHRVIVSSNKVPHVHSCDAALSTLFPPSPEPAGSVLGRCSLRRQRLLDRFLRCPVPGGV